METLVYNIPYDETRLFIGSKKHRTWRVDPRCFYLVDASTGDSLWTYQTDNDGFYARTYVQDGVVYGGTKGNSPMLEVVALDAETAK